MTAPGDLRTRLQATLGSAFRIEHELGGGGMSRVFVAEETRLARKVVVKVLSPELAEGISVERFEREIRLAASLQHAHIVPVLATGEVDGLPWFTMPFIEGESLRQRVGRGALPIGECISILRDVARALMYAHGREVVHRDIKPDNVMFSAGSAVVTDFGIAKALSASRTGTGSETLTQLGTSIGTPAYMAPEQAAGDPNVDARADIYAFGCTAYELLTGSSPFAGRTPQRMLAAHMAEVPRDVRELRPDTPPPLADLVMRSLAKDANDRPQSATEIARALDTVTSGTMTAQPAILLNGTAMFRRALLIYGVAFITVMILAKAAIVGIGLPDWVFPGALIVMALGLPVILFTAYAQRVQHQIATATPTFTPGGTRSTAGPRGTMATMATRATPYLGWRRTARGGMMAVSAFVMLVGGFMALRALGIGPAGSLLAAGRIARRQLVLVTDFAVSNADSSLGRVLGDATRATLASSTAITLPSPDMIADALGRMQRSPTSTVTFDVARELALRNNIKAIVTGQVSNLGPAGYIVTLQLVSTDSAKELASFRESASDAHGLIVAIDRLSRDLRGRIGESLKSVRATIGLFDATTTSLDALRKYTEGERRYELARDYSHAITLLREAVAIDSTFAAAWRELAVVLSVAGTRAGADSASANAYRHRDRLRGSELDMVVGTYWAYAGQDRGKAIEAYESMMRRGDTAGPGNNLGLLLVSRREPARAESMYYAQERACPQCFRPLYGNLALALLRQNKLPEADSVISAGLATFPAERAIKHDRINIGYLKGDTAAFRHAIDSLMAAGDSTELSWARVGLRHLALRDGKVSEWRRTFYHNRPDSANATPRQRLNWTTDATDNDVKTLVEGRGRDIERSLDAALAGYNIMTLAPGNRPYLAIVDAYAEAGQPVKARSWLARYDAEMSDTAARRAQLADRSTALGRVLLAEHRYVEAIAAYRAGDRLPDGPVNACDICLSIRLALAFDSAGQVDSAITQYRRAIDSYSYDRLVYDQFAAPFSRRLGELYERKGDAMKAAEYYRRFATLWAHADPALQPQVSEIRQRIARLGDVAATVPLGKHP